MTAVTAPAATCGRKWGSSARTQACVLPPHDTGMHRDAKGREWPMRIDTPWWPGRELDCLTRKQLLEALACIEGGTSCSFWACEGPDARFTPMKTCNVCRATQLLRRACKRLGITPEGGRHG